MKMILIGLVSLLVLGGGAAGVYFYFMQPAEASAGPVDEHAQAQAEAEHAEKLEQGTTDTVEFVDLKPMILPIIGENGVSQTVTLVVTLEVAKGESAAEIEKMSPRLKDAYLQDMYGVLNRTASMEGGVLDVKKIKARLNEVTKQVMGEGKVNDVLLQVVQQRPI